jgi:hypothetical protein
MSVHQNLPAEFLWTAIRGCVSESELGSQSWSLMIDPGWSLVGSFVAFR